jgi:hypothetical protein
MSWPEPIASLLARPDTRPAQALRWGLHGLRASLRAALEDGPADAGADDLRALLAELAPLVDQARSAATLPLDNAQIPPAVLSKPEAPARGTSSLAGASGLDRPPGPDPRVSPTAEAQLGPLADAVSACLWLAENGPHARHCLKSVFRFGLAPLAGDQRDRYVAELLRSWERVRAAGAAGARERLKAHLDLDEAIHSLILLPPEAAPPWWGEVKRQARATLFAARDDAVQAGVAAHLQELGGSFAEINRLAPDSLQVDTGVPGEVCACLRVWARIDGEELKGRVLYRSEERMKEEG